VTGRRTRRRKQQRLLDIVDQAVAPKRHARLPVRIWRWRYELALVAGLALIAAVVEQALGITWVIVGTSAAMGALSPPWSERLRALAWYLVTPHLFRSGLSQAGVQNRNGWHPFIVRVTREPFGERVRLWCPAGTSAEDIFIARGTLRAACWAADIRVRRNEDHSQMVTVDVIRHRDRA
jgi:hypothetical protein